MDKDYLLEKWLNGSLTPEEQKEFEATESFELYQRIQNQAPRFKAAHFSKPSNFETFKKRMPATTSSKLLWIRPLLRIASVLVLGIAVYFFFFYASTTEITTMAKEQISFELPDASTVTLNAVSEISYSERNWKNKRELDLKGEAYFKVAKGKTFDVKTPEGIVTVVGTQFNVRQRDAIFEVHCYEGIVKVSTQDTIVQLTAGEGLRQSNGGLSFNKTEITAPHWTQNQSIFYAVPFSEVIDELERQFDVKVQYDMKEASRLFTGGFLHDRLEDALQLVTAPQGLTYVIEASNQVRLVKK